MENKGLIYTLLVAAVILCCITTYAVLNNQVDEQALSNKVAAQVIGQINVPTASEIAAEMPEISIPEIVIPAAPEAKEVNSDRIDDLWEGLYDDEIEELEAEAYDVAEIELEDHDYKDLERYLEANIEGFDELKDVDIDDYEVNIIALGLDDDEDKVADVVFELKIKYNLLEGQATNYKKNVIATATVSFDEGVYNDEDVELVFA